MGGREWRWWNTEVERISRNVNLMRRCRKRDGDEGWMLA